MEANFTNSTTSSNLHQLMIRYKRPARPSLDSRPPVTFSITRLPKQNIFSPPVPAPKKLPFWLAYLRGFSGFVRFVGNVTRVCTVWVKSYVVVCMEEELRFPPVYGHISRCICSLLVSLFGCVWRVFCPFGASCRLYSVLRLYLGYRQESQLHGIMLSCLFAVSYVLWPLGCIRLISRYFTFNNIINLGCPSSIP